MGNFCCKLLPPKKAIQAPVKVFRYQELERATNEFSNANFLGKGGFGPVHKGVLPDGREVAIKRLENGGEQGEKEFLTEVEIITRVHHVNLVRLIGYCITGNQRMLVYDFVANNSLKHHLHVMKRSIMVWPIRFNIALGTANGLNYLHEDCDPQIIHHDIKSGNILLDQNWKPKISDFGLARIFPENVTHIDASRMAGTFGYVPPEYAATGKLTDKFDVYGFGVILLELITGRPPQNLVDSVKPYLEADDYDKFVDPMLKKDYIVEEMTRLVKCAAACVRRNPKSRPCMNQVLLVLRKQKPLDYLNIDVAAGTTRSADESESWNTIYHSALSARDEDNWEESDGATATASSEISPVG